LTVFQHVLPNEYSIFFSFLYYVKYHRLNEFWYG
jgi:hypothetical protein